jgi:hypothetical protein
MRKYLMDFNSFVSELVNYHLKMKNDVNINKISEKIGISVSFFQKALYTPSDKHFNLKHIFLIADALDMSVEKFLPSKENYKLLTNMELSEKEWQEFLNLMKKEKE